MGLLFAGAACGDLAGPDDSRPNISAGSRLDAPASAPVIAIDSFGFPAPGGLDPLQAFDINDAGDIVAGRSLLRATGEVVTFSQIIQTRAVGVNAHGEALLWLWDSAGYDWSIASTNSITRGDGFFLPEAMNDQRQTVGQELSERSLNFEAALRDWDTHAFTDLHAQIVAGLNLDPEAARTNARSINNARQVVGSYQADPTGSEIAYLWQNGTVTSLGPLGGVESFANDINDSGQIVGGRVMPDGSTRAFFWDAGSHTDLGTLGGSHAVAVSINDLGQVVGYSTTAGGSVHPFIWYLGEMYALGLPEGATEGYADAINNTGKVVGGASPSGANTGMIWTVEFAGTPAIEARLLPSTGQGHAPVNRRGNGRLTVTILGSSDVNVADIDLASITLGDGSGVETPAAQRPNGAYQIARRDVDRDGREDLSIGFDIQRLVLNGDLPPGPAQLILRATTADGLAVQGTVSVRTLH